MNKTPEQIYKELLEIIDVRDSLIWEEGKRWLLLKEHANYKDVFGEVNSWKGFIGEVGRRPYSTVEYYVRLVDVWLKRLGYNQKDLYHIHTRKLDRAGGIVTKKNAEDVLSHAKHLSFSDFCEYLKGLE